MICFLLGFVAGGILGVLAAGFLVYRQAIQIVEQEVARIRRVTDTTMREHVRRELEALAGIQQAHNASSPMRTDQ